jgi:glucose-1-phosphatase
VSATDTQIDNCWNAMLVGLPLKKIELLNKLMQSHNVILLSNTNTIHLNYINNLVQQVTGKNSLDSFFHKAYYSHLMLMRKPDAEIFEYVLNENDFKPEQTLFLDDNKLNVQGAGALGINTVHVTSPDLILTYFHE